MDKIIRNCLFVCLLLAFCGVQLCDDSCFYYEAIEADSTCSRWYNWKLMRSIDCAKDSIYEICCFRYPTATDTRRRKWLSTIVSIGDKLSRSCTKRILCEQSCFNDDDVLGNSTRQIVFSDNSPANNEYVQAYVHKDSLLCHKLTHSSKTFQPTFSPKTCQSVCTKKYSTCQHELDSNFTVQCYYESARLFYHKLGLWFFSAFHVVTFDALREGAKNHKSVNETIVSAFTDLYQRMVKLDKAYYEWFAQKANKSVPNLKPQTGHKEKWTQFLSHFNRTDPVLVQNVHKSLTYAQFADSIAVIHHTLVSTEFEPNTTIVD